VIDALEGLGLVERRPDPDDRRAYQIHLTAEGAARLRQARARQAAVEALWLQPLSADERGRFKELLTRVAARASPPWRRRAGPAAPDPSPD